MNKDTKEPKIVNKMNYILRIQLGPLLKNDINKGPMICEKYDTEDDVLNRIAVIRKSGNFNYLHIYEFTESAYANSNIPIGILLDRLYMIKINKQK